MFVICFFFGLPNLCCQKLPLRPMALGKVTRSLITGMGDKFIFVWKNMTLIFITVHCSYVLANDKANTGWGVFMAVPLTVSINSSFATPGGGSTACRNRDNVAHKARRSLFEVV